MTAFKYRAPGSFTWVDQRHGTTKVFVDNCTPEEQVRLFRLGREIRLTDQILSDDLATVTIVEDGPAAAWTSLEGDHITFSMAHMPMPKGRKELAIWLGTNAHELGHVLFTPRRNSLLMRRLKDAEEVLYPGIRRVWNVLEDQREERLLIGRFSPWKGYLIAGLTHHLTRHLNHNSWFLFCGRTWMPDEVRARSRAAFATYWGVSVADQITTLVSRFQKLPDPGEYDAQEAFEIVGRIYDLIGSPEGGDCGGGDIRDGEPCTDGEDDDAPPTGDEAGEPCTDGEKGDGTDEGTGAGKEHSGSKHDDALDEDAIRKLLEEAVKDIVEHDEETAKDLDNVEDALDQARNGGEVEGGTPVGRMIGVTDRARFLWHDVGDALLDLKEKSEPAWIKRVDNGRLNVGRYVTGCDDDELFDRYEPGQMDASDLEVCLLVDVSGSMGQHIMQLGESVWAMRRAVEDLDGRITVLSYEGGHNHQVLCRPGDRCDDRMFVPQALGGTEPTSAIKQGWTALSDSEARNKLLIILTDGHWWSTVGDTIINSMNKREIVTVMAVLGRGSKDLDKAGLHGCQYGAGVRDPFALARLFRRIAAERIASWM